LPKIIVNRREKLGIFPGLPCERDDWHLGVWRKAVPTQAARIFRGALKLDVIFVAVGIFPIEGDRLPGNNQIADRKAL
jgi:hypothetical protein